jgi:hypothetical protein
MSLSAQMVASVLARQITALSTICSAYTLTQAPVCPPGTAVSPGVRLQYFCAPAATALSAQMVASAAPSDGSSLNDLLAHTLKRHVSPPGTAVSPGL